ncbi:MULTISPECIES: Clp protease N-terminal domain-containing protein [unclassified Leucobacter]|uniref:SRPBCC family protein n=1 Tax=unclassified Leucobacter TaxID=2621730 RepID=UPI00165E26DB|nr:SRPBCC family protein [Leucobacter sp. cx-87]
MSGFAAAAATSHSLSLAAMEEASRLGQRTARVEHLFLALVVNEQLAGQVLRGLGISLDSARQAVQDQDAAQLASIGVSIEAPPAPGRIVFHETGGYEWDAPSIEILRRASAGTQQGDAGAVLRALLDEPSGLVESVLHRLGVGSEFVRARLAEAERIPPAPAIRRRRGSLSGTSETFVPAPIEKVWELVSDPERLPEWDLSIGRVEAEATGHAPKTGDHFLALARTERPDGRPLRTSKQYRRQLVALVEQERPSRIVWRFSYPDAVRANTRVVTIALEPAAGGAHLRLELQWVRNPERQISLLGWLLRPLARFSIWMQLSQLGSSMSRVFR